MGWWPHAHHFANSLLSSISHHVPRWLTECTNRTFFTFSQTWHVISHAPSTLTHHVIKKEDLQNSWKPLPMLLQSRRCINQQKSGILQLPPHILWCISCQRYSWQTLSYINSPYLQWYFHILVCQEKYETSRSSSNT